MSQEPKSKLSSTGVDFTPTIHNDTYDFIKPEQFDLKDRAVFITGASKGVGRQTALSFAKAGASKIAVAARSGMQDLEPEILSAAKAAGRAQPQVLLISLDVTSEDSVNEAAKTVSQSFGRLDILVNNAGYLETFVPITETKVADWWKVWEVNIKGPYLVSRALVPLMFKSENSLTTVLNVSSIGAHALLRGASGYQSTKLALLRFSEFLCEDYKDQGLISIPIHPGAVMTELASGMPKEMHHVLTDKPILAADSIVWLTAERRDWLKGRYVSVTWDMAELLDKREKIEKEDLLKVRMAVGLE